MKRIMFVIFLVHSSTPSFNQQIVVDLKEVRNILDQWTTALNEKDLARLEGLYADKLIFYAKQSSRAECIAQKRARLLSGKYFHQEITTQPIISIYSSGMIKVSFVKKITSGKVVRDYNAYLLLKQGDTGHKIVGESDLVVDAEANFSPELGTELKQSRLPDTQEKETLPISTPNISSSEYSPTKLIVIVSISLLLAIIVLTFSIKQRVSKSNPELDGLAFEKFIVTQFKKKKEYFELITWTGDKFVDGTYARSSFDPDLVYEFRHGRIKARFALECKYRRRKHPILQFEPRQLSNYNAFQTREKIPVYMCLGLGGKPGNPKDCFIIPLDKFDMEGQIKYDTVLNYYRNPKSTFFFETATMSLSTTRKPRT